jgi:hypothetical protein
MFFICLFGKLPKKSYLYVITKVNQMARKLTNEELALALIKLKKEFNQLNDKVERMAEYLKQQHLKSKK